MFIESSFQKYESKLGKENYLQRNTNTALYLFSLLYFYKTTCGSAMIKSFKDLMARIPTCVGVIVYESRTGVGVCTISSFVSISVENGHEEVIFTLRRASNTGDELKKLENFSISILKSDQSDVAKLAGSNLPKKEIQELLLNNIERNSDNVLVLNESFITFVLKFKEAFSVRNSEIYLCQVLSGEQTPAANHLPMVYFDREFTTTQSSRIE